MVLPETVVAVEARTSAPPLKAQQCLRGSGVRGDEALA
jgi:hypothetical protein